MDWRTVELVMRDNSSFDTNSTNQTEPASNDTGAVPTAAQIYGPQFRANPLASRAASECCSMGMTPPQWPQSKRLADFAFLMTETQPESPPIVALDYGFAVADTFVRWNPAENRSHGMRRVTFAADANETYVVAAHSPGRLCLGSRSGLVLVIDDQTGEELWKFSDSAAIRSVAISSESVAWATDDGVVQFTMWGTRTLSAPLSLYSEVGKIARIALAGSHLVIASYNASVVGQLTVRNMAESPPKIEFEFLSDSVADHFGSSLTTTSAFDVICVGAPLRDGGAGVVYVFNTSTWQQEFLITGDTGSQFGSSIGSVSHMSTAFGQDELLAETTLVVSSATAGIVDVFSFAHGEYAHVGYMGVSQHAFLNMPAESIQAVDVSSTAIYFVSTWTDAETGAHRHHVYHTAFCARNFARRHRTTEAPPFECRACPDGQVSQGGLIEGCTACSDPVYGAGVRCYGANESIPVSERDSPGSTNLSTGVAIQLEVGVASEAGRGMATRSETAIFDDTAPEAFTVIDGPGSPDCKMCDNTPHAFDSDSQGFADSLTTTWKTFSDGESGMLHYNVCWGTAPGQCDVVAPTEIENVTVTSLTVDAALIHGQRYYSTVFGTNGAGLRSNRSSDGVTVDFSPPDMLWIHDGIGHRDVNNQAFTNLLLASWSASDNQSKVYFEARMHECVQDKSDRGPGWSCSKCNAHNVMINWSWARDLTVFGFYNMDTRDCGQFSNESCASHPVEMMAGNCYYMEARALNEAGHVSGSIMTDGVIVGTSEVAVDPTSSVGMVNHSHGYAHQPSSDDPRLIRGGSRTETRNSQGGGKKGR